MKRVWGIAAIAAALMLAGGVAWVQTHSDHPSMGEYGAELNAAAQYRLELRAKGLAIPASVSLEDLVRQGCLLSSDAKAFQGLRVTITLQDANARPQDALMSVKFPDGRELAALADGSIQQRAGR